MFFIRWAGTPLDFRQNNMRLIPEMTRPNLQRKISTPLKSKLNPLGSPMTGIGKLAQQTQTITNGPSGFLRNFMKKVWPILMKFQSTGAQRWERFWPTKKLSTEKVSEAAIRS